MTIPKEGFIPTVYGEGILKQKSFNDGEVEIYLDSNYCVTIYYTYKLHRRLYICCSDNKAKTNLLELPYLNRKVAVIAQLRNRDFDRYKEAMSYLNKTTKGEFYKLSPSFFWQLSILCRTGKNDNINIKKLVFQYNPNIQFEDIPKEQEEVHAR